MNVHPILLQCPSDIKKNLMVEIWKHKKHNNFLMAEIKKHNNFLMAEINNNFFMAEIWKQQFFNDWNMKTISTWTQNIRYIQMYDSVLDNIYKVDLLYYSESKSK